MVILNRHEKPKGTFSEQFLFWFFFCGGGGGEVSPSKYPLNTNLCMSILARKIVHASLCILFCLTKAKCFWAQCHLLCQLCHHLLFLLHIFTCDRIINWVWILFILCESHEQCKVAWGIAMAVHDTFKHIPSQFWHLRETKAVMQSQTLVYYMCLYKSLNTVSLKFASDH